MALYDSKNGLHQDEYEMLWRQLVPSTGSAKTVQGEMVRVVGKLADEYYRNGNINWDEDFEEISVWLISSLCDVSFLSEHRKKKLKRDIATIQDLGRTGQCPYTDGEDEFDRVTDAVVECCLVQTKRQILDTKLPL